VIGETEAFNCVMNVEWQFDKMGGFIYIMHKGSVTRIFDVRGWGFLTGTGRGGLGLSVEHGRLVQDAIGEQVCIIHNKERK